MGALTPILYQAAIPVFADVDPAHLQRHGRDDRARAQPDAPRRSSSRTCSATRADMGEIMELAARARHPGHRGLRAGVLAPATTASRSARSGAIGCFSLQQGKHITTGEGGLVVTDDADLARRMFLFINKAWGYGDPKPDHYFLALNYRMTELQGAVAVAQLDKLDDVVERRTQMAARLTDALDGPAGHRRRRQSTARRSTRYWKYCLRVDGARSTAARRRSPRRCASCDIASAPRYIQKPAFECEVFRDQQTFGNSRFPFTLARPEAVDYAPRELSRHLRGPRRVLVLP